MQRDVDMYLCMCMWCGVVWCGVVCVCVCVCVCVAGMFVLLLIQMYLRIFASPCNYCCFFFYQLVRNSNGEQRYNQ